MIHGEDEKIKAVKEAKEWFAKKCLYLKPSLREDYRIFINKVWMHKDLIEHWRNIGQSEGWDTDEVKKCKKEIEDNGKVIANMQKKIQEDIDQYYQNIQD